MKVVVTGSSKGMGVEIAKKFLKEGYEVFGLDVEEASIFDTHYHHYQCDVSMKETLPDIAGVAILINNAGVQNSGRDIEVNLKGVINCTEKYGLQQHIKSVLNQASVSAHNGAEFGEYTASKGGVLSYTVWTAKQIAQYGATCNSLSFGGVLTELNKPVIEDKQAWEEIMMMTPLRKWATEKEAAEWVYFMTVTNKSATGQDIIVDNGEMKNHQFVWR